MADILSLLIYLGALAVTLLIYHFFMKRKYEYEYVQLFVVMCLALPLAIIAGCRNDVGTDYNNYLEIVCATASQPWSDFFSWPVVELGFKLLIKLAASFSPKKEFLFFVLAYITVEVAFFSFYKLRNKLNMGTAIVLYYLVAYHPSLNIMRQMMAASVLLLMVTYLMEENYIGAIIASVVAILFHKTAVIGGVFIAVAFLFAGRKGGKNGVSVYVYNKKITYTYYVVIFAGTLAMPILVNIVKIIPWLKRYSVYLINQPNFGVGVFLNFFLLISPSLLLMSDMINLDKELCMIKNILFLYLPFSILGYSAPWASRMNVYIICIFTIYIPLLTKKTRGAMEVQLKGKFLTIYYWGIFLLKYCYEILYLNFNQTFPYFN